MAEFEGQVRFDHPRPSDCAVSVYPNAASPTEGEITTLGAVLDRMADLDESDPMVQTSGYLDRLVEDGAGKAAMDKAKARLPAAEFSLARTVRGREAPLGRYTGLVAIDYDPIKEHDNKARNALGLKDALSDIECIIHIQDSAVSGVWALAQLYPIPQNENEFREAVVSLCQYINQRVKPETFSFSLDDHTYSERGLRFLSPDIDPMGNGDAAIPYQWVDHPEPTATNDDILGIVKSALEANVQDRDGYDDWLQIGMGLHDFAQQHPHLEQALLQLWDEWSAPSSKFTVGVCSQKWATFGKREEGQRRKDINSVLNRARMQGWQGGNLEETVALVNAADTQFVDEHEVEGVVLHPPYMEYDMTRWAAEVAYRDGLIHYDPITGFWYNSLITGMGGGRWVPREWKTARGDVFRYRNALRKWTFTLGTTNWAKKMQNRVDKWLVGSSDESIWANICIPSNLPNELSLEDNTFRMYTRRGVMEFGDDMQTLKTVEWDPFEYYNKGIMNTYLTNAEIQQGYLEGGAESEFRQFMMAGCDGNEELYHYLALILGAGLSGEIGKKAQLVLFIIGNTGTGKSSLLTGLKTVFGDLCMSVVPKDIQSKNENHNDALADLIENRVRYAVMDEVAGQTIPVDALKRLSGGGYYTVRRSYGKGNIKGNTCCLAIAVGEHPPVVDSDTAFERRLRLLDWYGGKTRDSAGIDDKPYHAWFSDPESDFCRSLLMYVVNGYRRYIQEGINSLNVLPQTMQVSRKEFSEENDPLRYLLQDWVQSSDMHKRERIHRRIVSEIAAYVKESVPDVYQHQTTRGLGIEVSKRLKTITGVEAIKRGSRREWHVDNMDTMSFMADPEEEYTDFNVR